MGSRLFRTAFAAAGVLLCAATTLAGATPVPGQGTWQTVLKARDLDGDGSVDAWYDSSRNLSWATNANALGSATDFYAVRDWVASFDLHGVTGWRLPTILPTVGSFPVCVDYTYDGSGDCGYNVSAARSELAHMYQVVLGNLPEVDETGAVRPPGWGLTNTGPFDGLVEGDYPTALTLDYVDDTGAVLPLVWLFKTTYGYQDHGLAGDPTFHAWAVHDGDVGAALPEPGVGLLLLSAALAGALCRRSGRR